jgi:hypothetical protein
MAGKIDIKGIIISSAVTAITVAVVNNLFNGNNSGTAKRFMATLSEQELSKFAHPMTILNVNNESWLSEQLDKLGVDEISFTDMNKQQWGNLAFVALYSTVEPYRKKAMELIGSLKKQVYEN